MFKSASNNGGIEAISSEDIISSVDNLNKFLLKASNDPDCDAKTKKNIQNAVLIGADAVSLFPNLKKDKTAEIVAEELLRSEQEVAGVDWKELSQYVKINSTDSQQMQWNVYQYIPSRVKNQGIEPSRNSMLGTGSNKDKWIYPQHPGRTGTKLLMAAALRIGILVVLETLEGCPTLGTKKVKKSRTISLKNTYNH